VYWDVTFVKPLADFRIYVEILDGRRGVFDLKPYLGRGVLRELQDEHYFNQVGILFGAVTWPNEQDIAPETLLAEMLPVDSAAQDEALRPDPLREAGC
jgi:hypothetical protein